MAIKPKISDFLFEQTGNADIGNNIIASTFSVLYKFWPTRISFDADLIIGGLEEKFQPELKDGKWNADSNYLRTIRDALIWLNDEGYTRGQVSDTGRQYTNFTLTEKALRILKQIPQNLDEQRSYGEIIRNNISEVGSNSLKNQASELVGQLVGGVIRTIF